MLQNAYFRAKIGADTAENERNFAKNWQLRYGSTTLLSSASPRSQRPGALQVHAAAAAGDVALLNILMGALLKRT